jgi:hypothetical protein
LARYNTTFSPELCFFSIVFAPKLDNLLICFSKAIGQTLIPPSFKFLPPPPAEIPPTDLPANASVRVIRQKKEGEDWRTDDEEEEEEEEEGF